MHKRGEEESAGRVERVETTVRADLWQKESSKSETEGLKMVVRPAVIYGLEMVALTESQEVELEVAELKISTGSDEDGQDYKWEHQRDSSDQAVWRQS